MATVHSSSDRANLNFSPDNIAELPAGTLIGWDGKKYSFNPRFLAAAGVDLSRQSMGEIWDLLDIGGRIVQDPNANFPLYPAMVADMVEIETPSGDIEATIATLTNNIVTLTHAVNFERKIIMILLTYLNNYKIMPSATPE